MILIKKLSPPPDLISLQQRAQVEGANPSEAFKMLRNPLKGEVRDQLVEEQGGLCAYCMCRIPRLDIAAPDIAPIIIEHFIARNPVDGVDVGQGLDYNNLLAVCHGNRGPRGTRTLSDLICDAHRENIEFRKVDPTNENTLATIFYHLDGRIDAGDEDIRFDLLETLNLNCPTAPQLSERKAALDTLLQELGVIDGAEELIIYCETSLNAFSSETVQKTPYVGILIWYLEDLLEKLREAE